MLTLAAVLSLSAAAQAGPYYYLTDLGFIDTGTYANAYGMNNNGDVVGRAKINTTENRYYAYLYTQGKMYNLGYLTGASLSTSMSEAVAINDDGQITGYSRYTPDVGSSTTHAFLYEGWEIDELGNFVAGTMNDLDVLTYGGVVGTASKGYGINGNGDVVGFSQVSGRGRGFLKEYGEAMVDIGMFPGASASTSGNAINDNGVITGQCPNGTYVHAFLKNPGEDMVSLGALSETGSSYGNAINDDNLVAGYSTGDPNAPESSDKRAFLWSAEDGMISLGTLGTGDESIAYGINADGDVVGYSNTNTYKDNRAFIYTDGTLVNLNERIHPSLGWTLSQAYDINDNGQICGYGNNGISANASFILDPAIPGDANLDKSVNLADLGTLIDNYGATAGATWWTGDFNDDGAVNLADLGTLIDNYGNTSELRTEGYRMLAAAGIMTVPEPSSLVLLVFGFAGALAYFWKKRS